MSGPRDAAWLARVTTVARTALVPEIALQLAAEPDELFAAGLPQAPYWSIAWPGGQALARHILDHPRLVLGKVVLDIGSGSGIASIAARLAGAGSVTANDIDPLAGLAARSNAGLNGVAIDISGEDMLGAQPPAADLVLLADLVYDPEVMTRTTGFLEMARRTGLPVLIGDRTAARRPPLKLELVAEFDAPVTPPLSGNHFDRARVWSLPRASRS